MLYLYLAVFFGTMSVVFFIFWLLDLLDYPATVPIDPYEPNTPSYLLGGIGGLGATSGAGLGPLMDALSGQHLNSLAQSNLYNVCPHCKGTGRKVEGE